MTSMNDTPETEVHPGETIHSESGEGFTPTAPEESPAVPRILEVADRKQEEGKMKAQAKAESKKPQYQPKEKKSSSKVLAGILPMVEPIGEQLRITMPKGLVAVDKAARKQHEKTLKAQLKAEKKKLKKKLKKKTSSAKELASSFPM